MCSKSQGTVQLSDTQEHSLRNRIRPEILSLAQGTKFAQYEVIREIDRGGMSSVFLARDLRLGRRVAIKFLAQKDDPAWGARFAVEARVTARCEHENIVTIYDVGEAFGHSYMALEYLEGITLREWMSRQWRPDELAITEEHDQPGPASVAPVRAAEIMIPVVRALAHAHGLGLVHRDLKPSNIMLVDNGTIKVLDFGVAKAVRRATTSPPHPLDGRVLDDTLASRSEIESDPRSQHRYPVRGEYEHRPSDRPETRADAIVGTMPYMSPEQWGADVVDQRSDLWSVGIMLWEMVMGSHPLAPLSVHKLRKVEDSSRSMPLLSEDRPDLGRFGEIVDRCLRKRKVERIPSARELLEELESILANHDQQNVGDETADDAPPFVGMSAFQESDANRFFGRDRDVASVLVQLRNQQLVTIVAPAGAGKSSFVRAGLLPALRRSSRDWEVFIVRPGRHPLASLASVLHQVTRTGSSPFDDLRAAAERERWIAILHEQPGYLGAALRTRARRQRGRGLLFVDQFEELYTHDASLAERKLFVECLDGVADDASSPLRVLIALRSDHLDRVAEDRAFTREITRGLTLLPPMGRGELHEVLEQPLESVGYAFEDQDMVEDMLDTLESTRNPLPILQFTMSRLWEHRDREVALLTRASYEDIGGVAGALATHADSVLANMSARDRNLARSVLTALVTDERSRAMVAMDDLRSVDEDAGAVENVVHELADARLLLIETDFEQGATVELCHESLIEWWPTLGRWLDENHEDAQFRTRLRAAAREWHKQGRSDDLLWRGRSAQDSAEWLTRYRTRGAVGSDELRVSLTDRDLEYLEAVVALAKRGRKRRQRRMFGAFAFLGAIALLVSLLAVRASREARRAEEQALLASLRAQETSTEARRADQEAARARAQAMQARNATRMATARSLTSDPTSVLALAREMEGDTVPPGWSEMTRWALESGVARVVLLHDDGVTSAWFSPDGSRIVTSSLDGLARVFAADGTGSPIEFRGHDGLLGSARFSPDGTRVITASLDGTARIWTIDGSASPIVLAGHEQQVYHAAFSPDGERVVTTSFDKTARVWSVDGTRQPVVLEGHGDRVYAAAFSPDGEFVATASGDGTVRIWRTDGTDSVRVLRGHEGRVYSVSFSNDGGRLASASEDRTARVWPLGGGPAVILSGHDERVYWASFSPDDSHIVTSSMDKTVRVWRADGGGIPSILHGHQRQVFTAAFHPDGSHVISASADGTVRIWPTDGSDRPLVFREHRGRAYSAMFSPDGTRAVSTSGDKSVRVWPVGTRGSDFDMTSTVVLGDHADAVYSAWFSPDGEYIATASADGLARVWPADGKAPPILLVGHEDRVYSVAFGPDGNHLVTASGDKTARLWRLEDGGVERLTTFSGHDDRVYSAEFSPDGHRVVTSSADGTARIWRVGESTAERVLSGHDDRLTWATFSPDGSRILTASHDRTARLWDIDGNDQPLILRGHEAVVAVRGGRSFSPDGTRVMTHSDDRTIRIWDARNGTEILALRAPDAVNSAAFSPDGERIISAHADGTVWVWDDLEPLHGKDDARLWGATDYCMPVALRMSLLGVDSDTAAANRASCIQEVARHHTDPSL